MLWEYKLPAAGYATPSMYALNGRQYVVIAAGGGGKLATKFGESVLAFALPEATTPKAAAESRRSTAPGTEARESAETRGSLR